MNYAQATTRGKEPKPEPALKPGWVNLRLYTAETAPPAEKKDPLGFETVDPDERLRKIADLMRTRWDLYNSERGIEYDYDFEEPSSPSSDEADSADRESDDDGDDFFDEYARRKRC
jgi:hypothetical protein